MIKQEMFADKLYRAHCGNPNSDHVCASGDGLGFRCPKAVYGCPTLIQLQQWFKGGLLEEALTLGYQIKRYIVKDRIMGNSGNQCAYYVEDILSEEVIEL